MRATRSRLGGAVDWASVRERLARAEAATGAARELPPDQARAVLDERGRRLARPLERRSPPSELIETLVFSMGRERYALETRHLREVVRLLDFTPVPGAPDFLLGVTNLRGEILAVADLRKLLGVDHPGLTDLSRVIVLGAERAEIGLLADAAHELRTLPRAEILEPPGGEGGIDRQFLLGITRDALVVLDGQALLRDQRLTIGGDGDGT